MSYQAGTSALPELNREFAQALVGTARYSIAVRVNIYVKIDLP